MLAFLQLLLSLVLLVLAFGGDLPLDCHPGDTVTLHCPGITPKDSQKLLWMFEGKPAFSCENGSCLESSYYVNKSWHVVIQQNNFSLVIPKVSEEYKGVYTCRISEDRDDMQRFYLIVNDTETHRNKRAAGTQQGGSGDAVCHPPFREGGDPTGASSRGSWVDTVKIVVPVLVVVALVVAALVLFVKWRKGEIAEWQAAIRQRTEDTSMNETSSV